MAESKGIHRNPKTILRIMKKYGLLAEIRRRRKWVQMGQQLHKYENLLNRQFQADRPKDERRKLLKLVDLEAELRDEISLASFAAGFCLPWEIIAELNTEPPYSFTEEEHRGGNSQSRGEMTDGKETRQRRGQHPQAERWPLGRPLHGST